MLIVGFGIGTVYYIKAPQKEIPILKPKLTFDGITSFFKSDVLVIVGEKAKEIELDTAYLLSLYSQKIRGDKKALIKTPSELTKKDLSDYNLIVVGTPRTNSFLKKIYKKTGCNKATKNFPGKNKGMMEIVSNPWNIQRVILLFHAKDPQGVGNSLLLLTKRHLNKNLTFLKNENKVEIWFDQSIYSGKEMVGREEFEKRFLENLGFDISDETSYQTARYEYFKYKGTYRYAMTLGLYEKPAPFRLYIWNGSNKTIALRDDKIEKWLNGLWKENSLESRAVFFAFYPLEILSDEFPAIVPNGFGVVVLEIKKPYKPFLETGKYRKTLWYSYFLDNKVSTEKYTLISEFQIK